MHGDQPHEHATHTPALPCTPLHSPALPCTPLHPPHSPALSCNPPARRMPRRPSHTPLCPCVQLPSHTPLCPCVQLPSHTPPCPCVQLPSHTPPCPCVQLPSHTPLCPCVQLHAVNATLRSAEALGREKQLHWEQVSSQLRARDTKLAELLRAKPVTTGGRGARLEQLDAQLRARDIQVEEMRQQIVASEEETRKLKVTIEGMTAQVAAGDAEMKVNDALTAKEQARLVKESHDKLQAEREIADEMRAALEELQAREAEQLATKDEEIKDLQQNKTAYETDAEKMRKELQHLEVRGRPLPGHTRPPQPHMPSLATPGHSTPPTSSALYRLCVFKTTSC